MAMSREDLITSLQQSRNPYVKKLQNWTDNYNSRGMNTGTGQRNVSPPTTSSSTSSSNGTASQSVGELENTANQNTTSDKDFWSQVIRQAQGDQYTAADYFINKGKEADAFHNTLQRDLNEGQYAANRQTNASTAMDNAVQKTYDSIDKWNEFQSLEKRNTEDKQNAMNIANLQASSNYNVAKLQSDAQVQSARVSADASERNTMLNAYSNLYSNFVAPRGDFKYW